jgi:hydrogenase expression/formation protein HypD
MKYVDEYRSQAAVERLVGAVRRRATRPWTIMEVCGGQTHGLLRYGIDDALAGLVELIHGPGCPVCVTPLEAIDLAQRISLRDGCTLASFGDMLRVPGSHKSLLDARAEGASVQIVYSPLDAVALAARHRDQDVVFFAVGFETTAPTTALAVMQARKLGLENFSLLVAHVRVQPAMEAVMQSEPCRVEAFLAAGHVSTVMGYEEYDGFVARFGVPVVVTGFEPTDLLSGILACVEQLESRQARVDNQYARSVERCGNRAAQDLVSEVYEVCDRAWRGLGVLPAGGLRLREPFREFDAERRFSSLRLPVIESSDCRAGEVLAGRLKPRDCPSFATHCTPQSPLGAPMVSHEGACAAYYQYARRDAATPRGDVRGPTASERRG